MQRAEQEQLPTVSTPATAMRYRDVAAAADWLCAAFGFEKQTVLTDDAGRTLYAQLTFGRALLMLAPVGDSPIERFMKQPDEIGGAETQSTYIAVADADAHHARAKAAGAEIVLPVEDDDFGGRGFHAGQDLQPVGSGRDDRRSLAAQGRYGAVAEAAGPVDVRDGHLESRRALWPQPQAPHLRQ